jgi:DNA-binding winged helix-turn-helix (wHTH) protein
MRIDLRAGAGAAATGGAAIPGSHGHFPDESFKIGDWDFVAGANELRSDRERKRLEHRAARVLTLLCRNRGQVVSSQAFLEEVWGGRVVSANSLAIVVRDLRHALGDDARKPVYIETVPKRGYRLLNVRSSPGPTAPGAHARRLLPGRGALAISVSILTAAAGCAAVLSSASTPLRSTLAVLETTNATGRADLAPLARASSDVLVSTISRKQKWDISRSGRNAELLLRSRLTLWSGEPSLSMRVERTDGTVLWTAYTTGSEDAMPRQIGSAVAEMDRALARRAVLLDR